MIDYYSQHPLYAALIIVLLIITLFVCFKAFKAASKRNKETRELMNELHRNNELKNKYSILTRNSIISSDEEELFIGVGLNLLKRVADKKDMAGEFNSLSKGQKYIYALFNLYSDSRIQMSDFFRANTDPLTSTALEAVKEIFDEEFTDLFIYEYNAFDEKNEKVSFIKDEVSDTDKKTAPYFSEGTVCKLSGKYIKDNIEDFI